MKGLIKQKKIGLTALLLVTSSSIVWANLPADKQMAHIPTVSSSHLNKAENYLFKKRHYIPADKQMAYIPTVSNSHLIKVENHLFNKRHYLPADKQMAHIPTVK